MPEILEKSTGAFELCGPFVDETINVSPGIKDKLIRAGAYAVTNFVLRTADAEQRRLLAKYLGRPARTLDQWRQKLLAEYPDLNSLQPCELGPLVFGEECFAGPLPAPEETEYIHKFKEGVGNYNWARAGRPTLDLRQRMHKPVTQGGKGICWACTATATAEGTHPKFSADTGEKASEKFVIQVTKADIGDPWPNKEGGSAALAAKAICKRGLVSEEDYPTNPATINFRVRPPADIYREAAKNKFASSLDAGDTFNGSWDAIAAILNGVKGFRGRPLTLSIPLYSSFRTVGSNGIVPDPLPGESIIGYHAMTIVGMVYLKVGTVSLPYLIVRNSWGENWGYNGYCFISMSYFKKHSRRIAMLFTQVEACDQMFSNALVFLTAVYAKLQRKSVHMLAALVLLFVCIAGFFSVLDAGDVTEEPPLIATPQIGGDCPVCPPPEEPQQNAQLERMDHPPRYSHAAFMEFSEGYDLNQQRLFRLLEELLQTKRNSKP